VFGTVYELTENIVVPALVHGFYNATLFGTLYVGTQLSGMGGV
jgi:membrane protease YdiL (CAAX protease family)